MIMAKNRIDLTNKTFGNIKVLSYVGPAKYGGSLWECECFCGKKFVCESYHIRTGWTSSCGCLRIKNNTTHGCSYLPEHRIWREMRQRCTNPRSAAYPLYGGRGISICERWSKFENFFADMGSRPNKNFSLDRENENGNYELGNCKWATKTAQAHHFRKFKNNSTGFTGTSLNKDGRYEAYIWVNSQKKHLGEFHSLQQAVEARKEAQQKYWGKET
jgi:hypothetical protein